MNLFRSFFTKKDQAGIITPIKVENKEPIKSPSSDSDDLVVPTKRSKKRVLSFDENDQDENIKQMKIIESPAKVIPIEQKK
jgi:hypothetical protein